MQHELKISPFDLLILLVQAKERGVRLNVELTDGKTLELCSVADVNEGEATITLKQISAPYFISVDEIKCIEFQTFFPYKGESAKIYAIE
jgi:hypothetical protein